MEINLAKTREKASLMADDSEKFEKWFDENYYDIIENADDYMAQGVHEQYLLCTE